MKEVPIKKADAPQDDDGRSLGDREENKTLALARKVIDGITDSDAFFDAAIEGDIYVNDISNPAYLELMGAMTKDYVQKRQNLFTAPQLAAIETFGTAPYAQHQQRLLDNTKQRMSREEINHAKDTLVEYNARIARTLREFKQRHSRR